MLSETKVGPQFNSDGALTSSRASKTGASVVTDAHGRYQEAVLRGNVYTLTVAAGAATAFVGGAAGTPFVSIYNPAGSGKAAVLLQTTVAVHVAASAAGVVAFSIYGGVSAANTGTLTAPTNMYTLQKSGSAMSCSSNAATTSTTAVTANGPIYNVGSYYWATAAASNLNPIIADIAGAVVVAPGNFVALGGSAALTSATYDVSLTWEEVII